MSLSDWFKPVPFIKRWTLMCQRVMAVTNKGCRTQSFKRTGKGDDRRKDKLEDGLPKAFRQYRNRYA